MKKLYINTVLITALSLSAVSPAIAQQEQSSVQTKQSAFTRFKAAVANGWDISKKDAKALFNWGKKKVTWQTISQKESEAAARAFKRTGIPAGIVLAILAAITTKGYFSWENKNSLQEKKNQTDSDPAQTSDDDSDDEPDLDDNDDSDQELSDTQDGTLDRDIFNAIAKNDVGAVKAFHAKDNTIITTPNRYGMTPMGNAMHYDNKEMVKLLAKLNLATLTTPNPRNSTPMDIAMHYKNRGMVRLLAELNPTTLTTPNRSGITPMDAAIRKDNKEMVRLLAELNPATLTTPGRHGWTPMEVAKIRKNASMEKLLKELIAKYNTQQ